MGFAEVNVFGVYVAPISLMMVAAWLVVIALRRVADHFGLLQHVWYPADRRAAYRRASAAYQATDFNVIVLNQDLQYATARGVTGIGARDPLTLDVRGATVPAGAVP